MSTSKRIKVSLRQLADFLRVEFAAAAWPLKHAGLRPDRAGKYDLAEAVEAAAGLHPAGLTPAGRGQLARATRTEIETANDLRQLMDVDEHRRAMKLQAEQIAMELYQLATRAERDDVVPTEVLRYLDELVDTYARNLELARGCIDAGTIAADGLPIEAPVAEIDPPKLPTTETGELDLEGRHLFTQMVLLNAKRLANKVGLQSGALMKRADADLQRLRDLGHVAAAFDSLPGRFARRFKLNEAAVAAELLEARTELHARLNNTDDKGAA